MRCLTFVILLLQLSCYSFAQNRPLRPPRPPGQNSTSTGGVQVDHDGITYPDGSRQTTALTGTIGPAIPAGSILLTPTSDIPAGFSFTGQTLSSGTAWNLR